MTELVAQNAELALFRDEPGGVRFQEAHRELAVVIRRILMGSGLVIVEWSMVINVYLIATQKWGEYCRFKIMERVDDMVAPWLEKSKIIGQSEEEQASLMDEMMAAWGRNDPRFLKFVRTQPQSIEENEMPLSIQDKQEIKAMISESVSEALKNCSMPVGKITFSTGQVVAIFSAIISSAFLIGGAVYSVKDDINDVKVEVRGLSTKIDERIPTKIAAPPTSTDSGSSKPHTTTDGPLTP